MLITLPLGDLNRGRRGEDIENVKFLAAVGGAVFCYAAIWLILITLWRRLPKIQHRSVGALGGGRRADQKLNTVDYLHPRIALTELTTYDARYY